MLSGFVSFDVIYGRLENVQSKLWRAIAGSNRKKVINLW